MFAVLAALMLLFPGPSTFPRPHALSGTVTVVQNVFDPVWVGSRCQGRTDYGDVQSGQLVVIRDRAQRIVATAKLSAGIVINHELPAAAWGSDCQFAFQITALPYRDLYTIELDEHGQSLMMPTDLAKRHWHIALNPYGLLM